MTHYTISAAAQELRAHELLVRVVCITEGIRIENNAISEDELEQIRLKVYRLRGDDDENAANDER